MITTESITNRIKEYYCSLSLQVTDIFEVIYSEEYVEKTNSKLVAIAFPKQDGAYSMFYIKEYPNDVDDEIIYLNVISWLEEKQYEDIIRVAYYKTDDNFDVIDYYY